MLISNHFGASEVCLLKPADEFILGGMVLNLEKKIERLTLFLRLDGELDMHTSDLVRNAIDIEIEKRGRKNSVERKRG